VTDNALLRGLMALGYIVGLTLIFLVFGVVFVLFLAIDWMKGG